MLLFQHSFPKDCCWHCTVHVHTCIHVSIMSPLSWRYFILDKCMQWCTRVFHFHCILDPWDPGLFLLLISGHFQSTVCLFGNVVPKQLVDGCPWNELEFFFLHCWLRFLMCTLWHYELFLTWSVANVFCSFACLWVIFVMNIYVSCTDLLWQGVDWWPLFPQKAHCTTSTASMLKQVPGDEAYFVLFVCKQFKIVEHFVDSRAMSDIK